MITTFLARLRLRYWVVLSVAAALGCALCSEKYIRTSKETDPHILRGTIFFDAYLGLPAATSCDEIPFSDDGLDWDALKVIDDYRFMCEQVAQRVKPLLRNDSKKFDIWLASNGMSSLAGFPFTSWRVDETVVIDTCDPDSNSISTRFVDIRYFADTPRIFWAFVGNVIVYFVLTMLSSVGIQNWMRWRIRNRTAFPFELV